MQYTLFSHYVIDRELYNPVPSPFAEKKTNSPKSTQQLQYIDL